MVPRRARAATVLAHLTLVIALLAPVVHAALYFVGNRFPLFVPMMLPLSWVDLQVPQVPQTVWIYLSDYLMVFLSFLLCRQPIRFTISFVSVIAICVLVQWLVPIEFPRALFPIEGTDASARALRLVWELDAPGSCFPSLHVALTCVALLEARHAPPLRHGRWVIAGLAVWAVLICVATITTKQHYAVDVAGGVLLALGVHLTNRAWLPGRPQGSRAAV